jgi:peptidoglycan/xylan/chitin deacetylase (PgdA/CDA1 family)
VIRFAQRVAKTVLRNPAVSRAVRGLACARGHRLVLVYHRLGPPVPGRCEIVPSVPIDLFRAHLQALGDVTDLVGLDTILARDGPPLASSDGPRPAVAVTFDDDLPSHAAEALPVLRELGVPATFFLSGRVLHGAGPYWFQQLEAVLVVHGHERTAALLGLPRASSGDDLVLRCEQDSTVRAAITDLAADLPGPRILDVKGLTALARAGMTIGFHTLDHGILPHMDDAALERALARGRDELGVVAGTPLRYFAYPYGKADQRAAAAVRRAGYDAAFTGRPEPLRRRADQFRLGRWEPGRIRVDDLLVTLAVRLHRAAPAHRSA